jgi:hypothetical protein
MNSNQSYDPTQVYANTQRDNFIAPPHTINQPNLENVLNMIQQYLRHSSSSQLHLSSRQKELINDWQREKYLHLKNLFNDLDHKKNVLEKLNKHKADNTFPNDIKAMYKPYPNLPTCVDDQIRQEFIELERLQFLELQGKVLDSRVNFYMKVVEKLTQCMDNDTKQENLLQELVTSVPVLQSNEMFAKEYVISVLEKLQEHVNKREKHEQDAKARKEENKMDVEETIQDQLAKLTHKFEQLEAKLNVSSEKKKKITKSNKKDSNVPKKKKSSNSQQKLSTVDKSKSKDFRNNSFQSSQRKHKPEAYHSRSRNDSYHNRQRNDQYWRKNEDGRGQQRWDQQDHRHDQTNFQRNRPTYASVVKGNHLSNNQRKDPESENQGKRRRL